MGTDIHIYAERLTANGWERIPAKVPDDRNYWAFAVLADVRNGSGFAGIKTGVQVTPIAQPRGIPDDTSVHNNDNAEYGTPEYCWLGDHSFSWVLLSELRALDMSAPVTEIGMVTQKDADLLDNEGTLPESWCGWSSNNNLVRRSWRRPLKEAAWLLRKILEEFAHEQEPEKVRFVFGFDS